MNKRGYSLDMALEFDLGFAPNSFSFLKDQCINKGNLSQAIKLGVVKEKEEKIFDFFRNRIMFPIKDEFGRICGFSGRDITGDQKAKYLNSPESNLFTKANLLFGIDVAKSDIRKENMALLVEGPFDVLAARMLGANYTVCSSGTAITNSQIALLKRYSTNIYVCTDDDEAGKKALNKAIPLTLENKANPIACSFIDDVKDLDELLLLKGPQNEEDEKSFLEYLNIVDGVEFLIKSNFNKELSAVKKALAVDQMMDVLTLVDNKILRDEYLKLLAKVSGTKKSVVDSEIKKHETKKPNDQSLDYARAFLPKGVDPRDWFSFGYYEVDDKDNPLNTGYYFNEGGEFDAVKRSNFIIRPLFHLYSKEDNKRMVEITNGFMTKIIEMPSRAMISLDNFSGTMYEEGHFLFEGNRGQLLKINRKIGNKFPLAYELKTLGWQQEGFFAFANCIVTDEVVSFNEMGIAEFGEKNYFSPSCSSIYNELRADDDPYENDRLLNMKKAPINFKEWCKLFINVYGIEHGSIGIGYALITVFRDIIFKLDNNCPHLFAYGEKRSGKSKFMESLSNLFFNPLRSFNLNSGTDFAFANYLSRFRNCFSFMNEFDDKAIKEEWFQALKAAYDGEGRERGKGGSRNRTEIQKVNSTIGLAGQYLSTRDDNSLLSRSIVLTFRPNDKRTKKQNDEYGRLKQLEEQGINSLICEIIKYRKAIVPVYSQVFHECFDEMKTYCKSRNVKFEDRINRNHCALLAMVKILKPYVALGFEYNQFFSIIMDKVIELTRIMSQSDTLSEYWRIVSIMADSGELIRGFHYRINAKDSLTLKGDKEMSFLVPKRLLFLRFTSVYSLYKQVYRKETGKEAMNQESIKSYFQNRDYYIGIADGVRFRGVDRNGKEHSTSPTTAFVFDYELLEQQGVHLDFSPETSPEAIEPEQGPNTSEPDNPFEGLEDEKEAWYDK